jgi:Skp family chaperone for outer membrane proteins
LASSGVALAEDRTRVPVESPVLTIDSERLFEDSAFGQAAIAEIEKLGASLAAENRRIEEELLQEEKQLTEIRPTVNPVEFRGMADAFDSKVQEIRRRQDAKSRELNVRLEERRVMFLNAAAPVLEKLMREAGAAIVLEQRSVFISSNIVDITQIAIERLDLVLKGEVAPPEKK